jgi:sterol desaturase/sphingolipid hydroxylase (fatty acid hydroxylase superfamily)
MTWNISATSYYSDWVVVPILACAALITAVLYHGLTWLSPLAFVLGLIVMSFIEYGVHRWAFHNPNLYRREHWMHHLRPAAYVGIPGWHTALYFILALGGSIGSFGLDFGAWLFAGIGTYYLVYIISHDRFHHGTLGLNPTGYWNRQARRHFVHHQKGIEANFGVACPAWDMLLGTFIPVP